MLTQSTLKEWLNYDPETGIFRWLKKPSLQRRIGSIAGGMKNGTSGYMRIKLLGRFCYSHRLAWLYMTGEFPAHNIDHINGVRHDNKWCNLRDIPQPINAQNIRKPTAINTSGFLGVHQDKRYEASYVAGLAIGGKRKHIGTFRTPELAYAAYVEAKRKHHAGCTI